MLEKKALRTCPRCCRQLPHLHFGKEVCNRCDDVLEFGYPSFPAFKLAQTDSRLVPQRMELSEGWVLPSYKSKQ